MLEPFGTANPTPMFASVDLTVRDLISLSGGKHTKLILEKNKICVTALAFGKTKADLGIAIGDCIHIAYQLKVNEFRGTRSIQILLKDFVFSKETLDKIQSKEEKFDHILKTERPISFEHFPKREDFVLVYRKLKQEESSGFCRLCTRCFVPSEDTDEMLSEEKLRLILEIFHEMGILTLSDVQKMPYRCCVHLNQVKQKINIEKSGLYRRLCNRIAHQD